MNYEISSQRMSKLKKSKESYSDMEDSESDDSDLSLSYKNEAYNCEICNKSFTLQFSLDRHIKVKHNNKDGSKNDEMYYYSADEGDVLPENSRNLLCLKSFKSLKQMIY